MTLGFLATEKWLTRSSRELKKIGALDLRATVQEKSLLEKANALAREARRLKFVLDIQWALEVPPNLDIHSRWIAATGERVKLLLKAPEHIRRAAWADSDAHAGEKFTDAEIADLLQ